LEEELINSRTQLRATVEQYEIQQEELRASNEELQAMNEELRSSAEELETSKEELQSVNEELTTVNQELKIKIEELSHANNNFENLMNATNIGTIFLDRSLKVGHFTPSAREAFNLIPSDIGRPLMDLTSKLKDETLMADIKKVLSSLQTIEREVRTEDGRSLIMRLSTYRTLEDKIEGIVITLVDVTEVSKAREELRQARDELEARVAARTEQLAAVNEALKKEAAQRGQIEDERSRLLSQLVHVQEDERRRFARDLHDQLGQQLTVLRMKLEALKSQSADAGKTPTLIEAIESILKRLDSDVDFMAWQLRPVELDDLGLRAALENYVKQWADHFSLVGEFRSRNLDHERFSPQVETNLYRIAQEALNNCAKHSGCTRAEILLELRDGHVALIIEDNGSGFEPETLNLEDGRWGLLGMRERASLLKGTLEIESSPGKGSTIFVRVPIPP
jgi:two-component system CheB/CheR fusion protein